MSGVCFVSKFDILRKLSITTASSLSLSRTLGLLPVRSKEHAENFFCSSLQ